MDKKEKKAYREQIKKDKARLKELRKLDKQNLLTEDETWEFIRLLHENTERNWKQTEKLQKVTFVFLGLSGAMEIVALVISILTVLKH